MAEYKLVLLQFLPLVCLTVSVFCLLAGIVTLYIFVYSTIHIPHVVVVKSGLYAPAYVHVLAYAIFCVGFSSFFSAIWLWGDITGNKDYLGEHTRNELLYIALGENDGDKAWNRIRKVKPKTDSFCNIGVASGSSSSDGKDAKRNEIPDQAEEFVQSDWTPTKQLQTKPLIIAETKEDVTDENQEEGTSNLTTPDEERTTENFCTDASLVALLNQKPSSLLVRQQEKDTNDKVVKEVKFGNLLEKRAESPKILDFTATSGTAVSESLEEEEEKEEGECRAPDVKCDPLASDRYHYLIDSSATDLETTKAIVAESLLIEKLCKKRFHHATDDESSRKDRTSSFTDLSDLTFSEMSFSDFETRSFDWKMRKRMESLLSTDSTFSDALFYV